MYKKMLRTFLITTLVMMVASCASITQGTSQTLTFNLEPRDINCQVTRDGDGTIGSVTYQNSSLTVSKDKDDIMVSCKAEGYKPKVVKIVSSASAAGVTGVLLDFGITDMITGAMYKYPDSHNIALEKEK
jgi:type 1 fimbria pilin